MSDKKNIFISYSRDDEIIANLLAYILEKEKDFKILIDRNSTVAESFNEEIQNMIRNADVILLILTNSSLSSNWVNQEIGFALGCRKRVWPLALQKDIKPTAMISLVQFYSLFDWSRPKDSIDNLVSELKNIEKPVGDQNVIYPGFGFEQAINGKIRRTEFVSSYLKKVEERKSSKIIYNQAAFSIFCASNDEMYRKAGNHSDEYMKLLLEEQNLLNHLIEQPNTEFKMIVWPVRAYEAKFLKIRFENLLNWMRKFKDKKNVKFVHTQYLGSNRLIVKEKEKEKSFCIEGYKLHHTPGYDLSIIKHEKSSVDEAVKEFDIVFNDALNRGQTKEIAIEEVEKKYKKVLSSVE